jgi:hypothetical protein
LLATMSLDHITRALPCTSKLTFGLTRCAWRAR